MAKFSEAKMEFVDLGLSVKWASCNVGAASPEDLGTNFSQLECENWDMDSEGRVPSREEFLELIRECTWRFTVQNGVKGDLVVGPNGNSIFLPASFDEGKQGRYWSSTPDDNAVVSCLEFDRWGARMSDACCADGLGVRLVKLKIES